MLRFWREVRHLHQCTSPLHRGADVEWCKALPVTAPLDRRQSTTGVVDDPLRALVVDDDSDYRAYVAALAQRLGFWVDTADDGEAGLPRLAPGTFDVAIIDHEMPRLNGIALIARLRADEETKVLYAMMLTAREDTDTKLAAFEAGFDDFLTKASSEREIVAKLVAARRIAARQRVMDTAVRDLYGLATHDDLTGLFNRRFFISETERLLAEGAVLNVVLLDLDDFKAINDTYGHLAGGVAAAIAALEWGAPAYRVTASAGFASSRFLERPTLAQLLNAADRDMYKNKWIRKHPDVRAELYEYPAHECNVVERYPDVASDRLK